MAAVTNATDTATANATTRYADWIQPISIATLGRIPTVYDLFTLRVDLSGKSTNTYSHNLRDEIAVASSLTETDEVTATEITRVRTQVSTATLAVAAFVSDQIVGQSVWAEMREAAIELTSSCARKLDTDCTALLSAFSSPIGNNATTNTVSNLVTLQTAWRARTGSTMSRPLLIMHSDAMRDLQLDAVANAAAWFGTSMGVQLHTASSGLNQGVVKPFGDVDMVVSDRVPAGDTTGWSNAMVARGTDEAAIAMAVNQGIVLEVWREPKRKGTWVIASYTAGFGEINDLAGLTFITKT